MSLRRRRVLHVSLRRRKGRRECPLLSLSLSLSLSITINIYIYIYIYMFIVIERERERERERSGHSRRPFRRLNDTCKTLRRLNDTCKTLLLQSMVGTSSVKRQFHAFSIPMCFSHEARVSFSQNSKSQSLFPPTEPPTTSACMWVVVAPIAQLAMDRLSDAGGLRFES